MFSLVFGIGGKEVFRLLIIVVRLKGEIVKKPPHLIIFVHSRQKTKT